MTGGELTDNAATVVIGQKVRPDCADEFLVWQDEMNRVASTFPGFVTAEVTPPTAAQPDWVVVYRFDSVANLQAWINSVARHDRLAAGRDYLDGNPTQQVIAGAATPPDQLVTVVVTHRVDPDRVEEFLAWQNRMRDAETRFPGYRGSELFRPIEGLQDEWTALYRYDSAADLDAWLTSPQRARLLAEGKAFHDFELRTVDNSFGNWFAFDAGQDTTPPSDTKSAIAVWVGLYPTVVLLSIALFPLKMPLWLGMLVGNLLSSIVMTFLVMPFYVNPMLKGWLHPPGAGPQRRRAEIRGVATIVAVMAAWTLAIFLGTTVIWHLS
ncbi:MAG: antibiotic biosynthesis monooxygenase [Mycobacterium sp.]|nr:antibiotic biosynthesis monooxygenase [Mycobacterium sp.]